MPKSLRELTKQAISDVLTDMFYLFPEQVELRGAAGNPDLVFYTIALEGPERVTITIGFSAELGLIMTANFLGDEAETIPPFLIQETLKEALNVIGGQVLNNHGDGWHLCLPRICDVLGEGECFALSISGHVVPVCIHSTHKNTILER